jgi:uncharacterized protein (TIGR02001 family)
MRAPCGPAVSTLLLAATATAGEQDVPSLALPLGAALTSDCVSSGVTNSDNRPVFQPYVEAEFGSFYAGIRASNVDVGDDDRFEIDLYVGWRGTWDIISSGINYYR